MLSLPRLSSSVPPRASEISLPLTMEHLKFLAMLALFRISRQAQSPRLLPLHFHLGRIPLRHDFPLIHLRPTRAEPDRPAQDQIRQWQPRGLILPETSMLLAKRMGCSILIRIRLLTASLNRET